MECTHEGLAVVSDEGALADPRAGVPARSGRLTPRQREVLGLMAEGLSNGAIGRRLGLPEKTIVRHASNVYVALGLAPSPDDHRRVRAVLRHHGIAAAPAPPPQARA